MNSNILALVLKYISLGLADAPELLADIDSIIALIESGAKATPDHAAALARLNDDANAKIDAKAAAPTQVKPPGPLESTTGESF